MEFTYSWMRHETLIDTTDRNLFQKFENGEVVDIDRKLVKGFSLYLHDIYSLEIQSLDSEEDDPRMIQVPSYLISFDVILFHSLETLVSPE